ncbi:MAG: hypothetical protein LKJ17_05955 [Oscillospiraceae bacterium]|jgi:hypothetical protein|nr:hypothetical protein [Oscillospiraceae bacterium]
MDYKKLGMEYLKEAQRLKEYLRPLRGQLKEIGGEDSVLLRRRISMLDEMHLELYHTGKYLLNQGGRL